MRASYTYKGYSLLLAISVMIIVSASTFLVISFFRMGDMLRAKTVLQEDAAFYVDDALAYISADEATYNTAYVFEHAPYKICAIKNRWGFYDCCQAAVLRGSDTMSVATVFTGYGKNEADTAVLYLGDSKKILYIADSVYAEGCMYVPEGAVRAYGAASNLSFVHSTLFQTEKHPMPKPDVKDAMASLQVLWEVSEKKRLADSIRSWPFTAPVLVIQEDTAVLNGPLRGHIAVCANTIIVKAGAVPDNILLLAHNIFFDTGFQGHLQAFATDTIVCGSRCRFTYPSLLALLPDMSDKRPDSRQPLLTIGDSTIISGELMAVSENELLNGRMYIATGNKCIMTGSIYSSAFLRLRGVCYGSFFCNKLLENRNGAIQENMLYNVTLSSLKLPAFFTYSSVYPLKGSKKIIDNLH